MTERKPPGMRFEKWIDKQIREAQERGDFDNLPGKGKPIKGLDGPYDEMWWIRQKLVEEDLAYLPPGLALRKKVDEARDMIDQARTENGVRAIIEEINTQIREHNRKPTFEGPPANVMPFDVERTLARWRERRAAG